MRDVQSAATAALWQLHTHGTKAICYLEGYGFGPGSRLTAASLRSVQVREVSIPGSPTMWARVGRGQTDLLTLLHVWRERCYETNRVVEPRWVLDIGANAGFATRWFAERYPQATVVAVEPEPANLELLRRNTSELPNVTIIDAALTDCVGTVNLVDVGDGPWGMRTGETGGAGRITGEVRSISMPWLLEELGIDRVDYLKIDIEGGELEVFRDAGDWIGAVDAIAVELHDRFRPGCNRAFYQATEDFDGELSRGENTFVWRRAPAGH